MTSVRRNKTFSVAEDPAPLPGAVVYEQLLPYLKKFADTIGSKFAFPVPGEPEEQLRSPFERLFEGYEVPPVPSSARESPKSRVGALAFPGDEI